MLPKHQVTNLWTLRSESDICPGVPIRFCKPLLFLDSLHRQPYNEWGAECCRNTCLLWINSVGCLQLTLSLNEDLVNVFIVLNVVKALTVLSDCTNTKKASIANQ